MKFVYFSLGGCLESHLSVMLNFAEYVFSQLEKYFYHVFLFSLVNISVFCIYITSNTCLVYANQNQLKD